LQAATTLSTPSKKEQPTQVLATISLDKLKEITRNFSYDTLIGQGSHSEVFLGELKDSRKCVVKILKYPDVDNEFLLKVMSAYSTLSTILGMALFINVCIKGLFSNFISCCRFSPFQDWSTTMLFNFLATV